MIAYYGLCDHIFREEIKVMFKLWILFSVIIFNMMKFLTIFQTNAGQTMIKESFSVR